MERLKLVSKALSEFKCEFLIIPRTVINSSYSAKELKRKLKLYIALAETGFYFRGLSHFPSTAKIWQYILQIHTIDNSRPKGMGGHKKHYQSWISQSRHLAATKKLGRSWLTDFEVTDSNSTSLSNVQVPFSATIIKYTTLVNWIRIEWKEIIFPARLEPLTLRTLNILLCHCSQL